MANRVCGASKGIVILVVFLLVFSVPSINFSSCQQSDNRFRAKIWVNGGCGSSYSNGQSIRIYFMVEDILNPCYNSGTPSDNSVRPL